MFDTWRLYRKPRGYASVLIKRKLAARHRRKMDAPDSASFGACCTRLFRKQHKKADESDGPMRPMRPMTPMELMERHIHMIYVY